MFFCLRKRTYILLQLLKFPSNRLSKKSQVWRFKVDLVKESETLRAEGDAVADVNVKNNIFWRHVVTF